jgi:hypothetical protein
MAGSSTIMIKVEAHFTCVSRIEYKEHVSFVDPACDKYIVKIQVKMP